MKICNKTCFYFGIFCAFALVLFAAGIIHAEWWQYLITIAISSRYIYIGLNQSASRHQQAVNAHYKETAAAMYGKHYCFKTNLPWIMMIVFYPIALALRFLCEIWLPVWLHALFIAALSIAIFYSIGINRDIVGKINEKIGEENA